ncbi:endonuclease [Bdellovibrio sp. BCCA]|uniref:endonuclease n=1 Tax=Bdellovibrio sp. BCCA TaxID=3136281 RepID=UPI0030F0D7CC
MRKCVVFISFIIFGNTTHALDFQEAKKMLSKIHRDHDQQKTVYCGCEYSGNKIDLKSCGYKTQKNAKRASRLEWEHIVPISAIGQSFSEWRNGNKALCGSKKGRTCAKNNDRFAQIEGDMHNLWPEIGELNGLRSNFPIAALSGSNYDFGSCKAKIKDKKFEPQLNKGLVARVYLYMDDAYPGHGIISTKNRKLVEAWDKTYPPSDWECERETIVSKIQGKSNKFVFSRCK